MAEDQAADGALDLGENLDIAHVASLKAALDRLLGQEGELVLDGRHVARSDAAGIQLLLAFKRQCAADGRKCSWQGSSEILKMDVAGLGLARELEINPQNEGGP